MRTVRRHWPIILVLTAYLGLGCAYSVINPLFESPDEVWHYEYVRWLVEGHGLPRPEQVGTAAWHQEGSQPPLYYLAAALITAPIPTDNAAAVIRYNPHAAVGLPDSFGNKNVMVHGSADAWPWRGVALAAHVARLFSLLLGAVTVLSAYGTAQAITLRPHLRMRPPPVPSAYGTAQPIASVAAASLAAALVAFNPQFLFISAAVNNDNLVIAASAAAVWLSVSLVGRYGGGTFHAGGARVTLSGPTSQRTWQQNTSEGSRQAGRDASAPTAGLSMTTGTERAEGEIPPAWDPTGPKIGEIVLLGVLVGIAALAKLSGLALAGLAGLALVMTAWRRATPFRTLLVWALVMGAALLVTAGWWYGRNLLLYGDPLGLRAMFDILPRRAVPPTPAELLARGQGVWRSAWAVFGWFNVAADTWLYTLYSVLTLAGLAGLIAAWPLRQLIRRINRGREPAGGHAGTMASQLILLGVWIVVVILALVTWAQMRYPQGRLLFPAISAAAVLLAVGLLGWLPARLHAAATLLIAAGLGILAAFALGRWIAPAYAAPQLLPPSADVPNPLSADFGGQVRLVGYEADQTPVQPGGTLHVTLYWEAAQRPRADYSVFVHLVDENEITQAQNDSYPAAGSLPTSEWPLGAIIPDTHAVEIPATAPAPQRLKIEAGLFDFATGARLLADGQDHRTLGTVTMTPRPSADGIPNPLDIVFADQIALIGFDMDRRVLKPGETLELTLWWKALGKPKADYTAFAHVVLPPGAVWAGVDATLEDAAADAAGEAPASQWQAGRRAETHYRLTLPAEAPPGVYFVEIGLYDPATLNRLTVDSSDAGVPLGYVRVQSGAETPKIYLP